MAAEKAAAVLVLCNKFSSDPSKTCQCHDDDDDWFNDFQREQQCSTARSRFSPKGQNQCNVGLASKLKCEMGGLL